MLIQGIVKKLLRGNDKYIKCPHSFIILGDDGKEYFAHLGDIKQNEEKLHDNANEPTIYYQEGERVKFKTSDHKSTFLPAMNVEKI